MTLASKSGKRKRNITGINVDNESLLERKIKKQKKERKAGGSKKYSCLSPSSSSFPTFELPCEFVFVHGLGNF